MSLVNFVSVVFAVINMLVMVGVMEIEIREFFAWCCKPMVRITVEFEPKVVFAQKVLFPMPVSEETDWDIKQTSLVEFEPVSDDSDPVLFNGQVIALTEVQEFELSFFGTVDYAKFNLVEEHTAVVNYGPPIKHRRFTTYMAECDYSSEGLLQVMGL